MSDKIIQVENLSKLYRLGTIGTGSLKHDLVRWWLTKVKGEEDPFLKLAEENERESLSENGYVWALKDINFEVNKGEVLGIIGRNGAGKSTLLKILSRVTRPTTGVVKGKGRVASLLEVGTGFHQELTGRENIFLNGNILGMTKKEVSAKFDEIVAFSGVNKYIDTPVKRYSSGMYVRLAFAVAAFLEPEILIVDEVLAVGDADFQKKCLGKMRDVSKSEGRTVLFVSHNMQAIQNLCSMAILLKNGKLFDSGRPAKVVNTYLGSEKSYNLKQSWPTAAKAPGNDKIKMKSIEIIPELMGHKDTIDIRTPLEVHFELYNLDASMNLMTGVQLFTLAGECIFEVNSESKKFPEGLLEGRCFIPGNLLNDGSYYISLVVVKDTTQVVHLFDECLSFELQDFRENTLYYGKYMGYIRPKFKFILESKEITAPKA